MISLLKNKVEILCLLIGLVIASIVFHYSIGMSINKELEQDDIIKNSYEYGANITITPLLNLENNKGKIIDDIVEFENNIKTIDDCYIYFPDIIAYIDDNYTQSMTDIYVCGNMPKYKIVSGRYPDEEMLKSGNRYVVLGVYKKSLTYNRDGRDYITIEGEEYEVCGYVSADNSRILDNKVILFAGNMGENMLDCMYYQYISGSVFLSYSSDTYFNIYNDIKSHIKQTSLSYDEQAFTITALNERMQLRLSDGSYSGSFSAAVGTGEYNLFAKFIYIFCIFLVIFVLEFWMLKRKNEFVIRKICGYSNTKIFIMIVKEIFIVMFISLVISEAIMYMFDFLENGISVFYSKQVYYRFVSAVVYVGISMVLTCIYPFIELCIKKPINLLKCKKDFY